MNWFYFAIFSLLAAAIANILNKVLMKNDKSDAMLSAILFQLIITSFYTIITVFTGFVMPPIMKYPVNFLLEGFSMAWVHIVFFKLINILKALRQRSLALLLCL